MSAVAGKGGLEIYAIRGGEFSPIPLKGTLKAGFPSPAQDFLEEDIDLVALFGMNKSSTIVVCADTHYCQRENLPENCYLIVDSELEPVSQDLLLVVLDGEYCVRTLVKTASGCMLHSPNPYISPSCHQEQNSFKRVGVVTQLIIDRVPAASRNYFRIDASSAFDLHELLGVYKPSVFIFRVAGNSMENELIPNNGYLVVDRALPREAHRVVVACLNGEFTVKTLIGSTEKWTLYPGNPHYPPIPVKKTDNFDVWGVVSKVIIDRKQLRNLYQQTANPAESFEILL